MIRAHRHAGAWLAAGALIVPSTAWALSSLQKLVDAAKPGTVLQPPAGTYAGPVTVSAPLVIDGQGRVTIDAGGKGSVVLLHTNGAAIKGL
ncbi:MAG: hypothetical protein P8Y25_08190, partial [Chromatiaceae bacterium]